MRKARKIHMHQTMFPLLIVNILENHATKERPLSVTEITEFVNREFGPFAMEKEQLMNRSTVTRILDAMEFWTEEGNLLNFIRSCSVWSGQRGEVEFRTDFRW